ncbi:hypothetical protein CYLTODRAFT_426527 [Cylindrobasidium torrendii FP15055 ss-10]|uniref:Oxo-4-hydroxy-4-carboxy-5-ureidoimidazoline decarboxylase domain-containing protein n=1 Tax=Cylindrobasidium torrendii FP15055 ss-10 TaxID=1314674 RepID=A0A0D7AXH3_9AGAR|nr:hypothetical protein CYLTODRAFT_426527 [Cylindrobasidium torrendii FP15055 ss-10]
MSSLPPDCTTSPDALGHALTLLFEHSPILISHLVPKLLGKPFTTYEALIDASLAEINTWDDDLRAQFIAGHPRIGETKNLSSLSSKEQGAAAPTPPEVLQRLEAYNEQYEKRYPGLRYITFVNGRSRAEIADEMAGKLENTEGVAPPADWKAELDRAVGDIGKIAYSRLKGIK